MVAQQNSRRLHPMLLGDLDNRFSLEKRPAGASQRAVGHDVYPLLLAEVYNLLLRQSRVVLDLVNGGDDGCVGEELVEVELAVLYPGLILAHRTRNSPSANYRKRKPQNSHCKPQSPSSSP